MKTFRFLLIAVAVFTAPALRAAETWSTNFTAAQAQAKESGKKLLVEFTGSDWCFFCIQLDKEVLGSAQFAAFAKDYVLVRIDFPQNRKLSPAETAQNKQLEEQFKVRAFPSLVIVDAAGRELGRAVGYHPGSGPKAYLARLAITSEK